MSKSNQIMPFQLISSVLGADSAVSNTLIKVMLAPFSSNLAEQFHNVNQSNFHDQISDYDVSLSGMNFIELGVGFNSHF